MKILITGAGGFLGRGLAQSLAEKNHEVFALDNDSRGSLLTLPSNPNIRRLKADVLDFGRICGLTEGMDAVYHLAYINGTKHFYTIPDKILEVGIIGTHNILKACLKNRVPRFYLASSSEVYQEPSVLPTPETIECRVPDVLNPRYSYGGGKIACELLAVNYLRNSGAKLTIFRPHNVYGPQMGEEHVIPNLIRKVHEARGKSPSRKIEIEIQGSGDETRSFIYVDDAVRAIEICTLENEVNGIVHVGTGEEVRIRDLVKILGKVLELDIATRPSDRPSGSPTRRCPDITKITRLGFSPQISLEEGVRKTVAWYGKEYSRNSEATG